jgi:hypothetical protein
MSNIMKSNVMPSIVQIEAQELEKLVKEVKETVATDAIRTRKVNRSSAVFGAIDLWNIQRRMKRANLNTNL